MQKQRTKADCTFPGCGMKNLVKLANHLKRVHHITSKSEWKRFLQKAKEVNSLFVTNTRINKYRYVGNHLVSVFSDSS